MNGDGFKLYYRSEEKLYCIMQSDASLRVTSCVKQKSEGEWEKHLVIENISGKDIYLEEAVLWEVNRAEDLAVGEAPYEVYRSGRHKNDMPGTFTLGIGDERAGDVLGTMTESGDKAEADFGVRSVISDHLTILKGSDCSLLVEFMGGRKQLFETVLSLDGSYHFQKLCAKVLFQIVLPAGKSVESETLRCVWTEEAVAEVERFAEEKAAEYGSRAGKHPAVFCTWYYYGLTVTYEDVKTNLSIMQERKLPFDVFQVDEGWEITLGEWQPNKKFPIPMKQVAEEIKQAGYRPGIWTSPFIAHETASIWKQHPEWCLKDKEGKPYLFPMNDTVYLVLDITNPATYEYFTQLYRMLTFDWGYTYHKLDFTRAAVIYEEADFYDKTIPLTQAYYRAVKAIREGMGEEAYFLMCGGLYDPIIGLVDAQRTGSDVLSMWSSTINKGGKTAPYTIKQSVMRYYMNKWWDNDPDALMIRKQETMERNLRLTYGLLNEEEVKTSVLNQFMGGGIMCATEPLDKITDDRLMEYRRILPVMHGEVRPVNLLKPERFPGMVDVYNRELEAHYLCVVNWEDEYNLQVELCIKELLPEYASETEQYLICDYYAGEYFAGVKATDKTLCKPIAPHGANVYKVVRMQEKPQVVKSTGHYSMGGEFDRLEVIEGKLYYTITNLFDWDVEYEVLLPDGRVVSFVVKKGPQEGIL